MTKQEKAFLYKRKWVVTSLEAARGVYVNHRDFVDKIRSIEKQLDPDFCKNNLIHSEHRTAKNLMYLLTKKGCKRIAEKLSTEKRLAFEQRYKELFDVPPADSAPETAPTKPKLDPPKPEAKSIELYVPQSVADFGVFEKDGKVVVSSRTVAKVFGKPHNHVLRDINQLGCTPFFRQSNFGQTFYSDEWNRQQPEIIMTRDGFMFLVMGYNGDAADAIKESYINVFNTMEAQLKRVTTAPAIDMNDPVELAKLVHKYSGEYLKEREANARLLVENLDLKTEREENAPKVAIAEAFLISEGEKWDAETYAQKLIQAGVKKLMVSGRLVKVWQNSFLEWLVENKHLTRLKDHRGFRPIGKAKNKEYIRIDRVLTPQGKPYMQAFITPPGVMYFYGELQRQETERNQLGTNDVKLLTAPDENGIPQIDFSRKRRKAK